MDRSDASSVALAFRSGDTDANHFVREHVRRVLSFRGYGIPAHDRQDLEQQVLIQLWKAARKSDFQAGKFFGLVEAISARRCIDWLRTRKIETPIEEQQLLVEDRESPLQKALARERESLARQVLSELPEDCRRLITLHVSEGLTYAELARVFGRSEGALRVRMHRCVDKARIILRDENKARS